MGAPARSSSDIIAAYLEAVMRKDESVVESFFDPNVEYVVNGTPIRDPTEVLPPISPECHGALPWLGIHRGRKAVKEFLAHMHRNLEITAFGPREVISEGRESRCLRVVPAPRLIDRTKRGHFVFNHD
jgi:hypothetical protein